METEREIDRPQSDKCEQCFRSSRFVAGAVSAAGIYKQSIFQVRFVFSPTFLGANLFFKALIFDAPRKKCSYFWKLKKKTALI